MKKGNIMFISVLLVFVLFVSGVFLLKDNNNDHSKVVDTEGSLEEEGSREAKTITYENGDAVYIPSHDDIGYDKEENIYFYDNLLNVYLDSKISDDQADELAELVDGTSVGDIKGVLNMLQLEVEAQSIAELRRLAGNLKNNELVKFAELSIPSTISALKDEDMSRDSEAEDEVDGDWWMEAINAPDAWEYMDRDDTEFNQVKVGVLETGRLGEGDEGEEGIYDDDLKDNVSKVSNEKGRDFRRINRQGEEVINSHARWVTKFIAADQHKKPKNFRGVAGEVTDVHFTAIGNELDNVTLIEGLKFWKVPEPYIFSIIKSNIENDVQIINNSWGDYLFTEKAWKHSKLKDDTDNYDDYIEAHKNSIDKVSAQLIVALDDFLSEEKDDSSDFLIIQGAGNGKKLYRDEKGQEKDEKKSAETATNTTNSGYFANINQATYDDALEMDKSIENELEDIQRHIIVVGGAEKYNDGYRSPEWASYGNAVDIAAPASNLLIDNAKEGEDGEVLINGTSFATPMVSGAAALIWSYKPKMKAGAVKDLLVNSAQENVLVNKGAKCTYPMLNLTAFLNEYPQQTTVIETDLKKLPPYYELIETYHTAISEQWEQSKLDEKDLGPNHYSPQPLSDDYGYELRDINGNGQSELILGGYRENGEADIREIYTLQNKQPIKIFESGIRTNVHIYQDGTIEQNAVTSPGRGIYVNMFYKLNDDGTKRWKEGYEENMAEESSYTCLSDPDIDFATDEGEAMTEDDVKAMHEKYNEIGKVKHSFTRIVEEKGEKD